MIKELKGTNLIAVEVAPDARNYHFGSKVFNEILFPNDLFYDTYLNVNQTGNVMLEAKYKILGEVTKDKVSFDVAPYVEKYNGRMYKDYLLGKADISSNKEMPLLVNFVCRTKEESFYSLLGANELYFVNPLGAAKYPTKNEAFSDKGEDFYSKWQYYEDKLIEKLLIIGKALPCLTSPFPIPATSPR